MSTGIVNITTSQQLDAAIHAATAPLSVCYFWASWCKPCEQMDLVVEQLAQKYNTVLFYKIEAEQVPEVAEKYGVSAVPYFVFLQGNNVVDKLEGANAPELSKKVSTHSAHLPKPAAPPQEDINSKLTKLTNLAPVMLFMKGTSEAPQCGFSSKIVNILKETGVKFSSFNILGDEQVRQGLKTFSNWPTFPQLYVNGKFIGGLDIVKEMKENGDLEQILPKEEEGLQARLGKLVASAPVMLFMKGNPEAPRCGFSKQIVGILQSANIKFNSFDILTDEEVRQGLKSYSNWPTYPQLYVNGKLIGGLDIVKEMNEDGSLQEIVPH
jgi:Grx4 family monothiol glutaredoxin